MGTKIKPGQFDCYSAALPDEPMFILLARDPDAAEAVRWWVTLRQARIGRGEKPLEDHALLAEALSCAASMVSWRDEASDPHEHGTTPRWKLPQAGTPMGGAEVDWPTLQVQTYVWEFGNRFRMWEALGDYWFAEWTEDEDSGQWSGAYPLQRNLQKEMLIAAYNDHRAAVQHKVEAVKSLLPLPHYGDIVRLVRDVARIKLDLDDFDGDRRGIAHALGEAGEALVEFVEAHAKDFDDAAPAPSVATSDDAPKMLSRSRISEFLDYASSYGEMDETTPDGTPCSFGGTPMNESRRTAIWIYKRVLGLIDENAVYPTPPSVASSDDVLAAKVATGLRQIVGEYLGVVRGTTWPNKRKDQMNTFADRIAGFAAELEASDLVKRYRQAHPDIYKKFADEIFGEERTVGKHPALAAPYGGANSVEVRHVDPPKAESDLIDVTDTPELPPHRFTIFTKSKHWGYGRGLEINPSHIPDMLDRMMDDGYVLQAVFGGVEPTKVGMLFRRFAVGGKVKAGSIVVHHDPASPPFGGIPPAVAGMMAQRNRYKA